MPYRCGEIEADPDVLPRRRLTGFDPRNTADHVGAHLHRIFHQAVGTGLAHDSVLREGDDLKVDDAAELVAHREQRLDALQARLAIDVGEGADVEVAVERRHRDRATRIVGDPGGVVLLLDLAREIDRRGAVGHAGRRDRPSDASSAIIGKVQTLQRCKCGLT